MLSHQNKLESLHQKIKELELRMREYSSNKQAPHYSLGVMVRKEWSQCGRKSKIPWPSLLSNSKLHCWFLCIFWKNINACWSSFELLSASKRKLSEDQCGWLQIQRWTVGVLWSVINREKLWHEMQDTCSILPLLSKLKLRHVSNCKLSNELEMDDAILKTAQLNSKYNFASLGVLFF